MRGTDERLALPGVGTTSVWVLTTALPRGRDLVALVASLPREDQDAAAARPEGVQRAEYVTARWLARLAIESQGGDRSSSLGRRCPSCGGPHGTVYWPEQPAMHFSMSHSQSHAAVGVSMSALVGVDVQTYDPERLPRASRLFLTEAERACLDGAPSTERARLFWRAWTRKEAIAKALGTGMRCPFRKIPSGIAEPAVVRSRSRGAGNLWTVLDSPLRDTVHLSVATPLPSADVYRATVRGNWGAAHRGEGRTGSTAAERSPGPRSGGPAGDDSSGLLEAGRTVSWSKMRP